jgi:hypothetical protein
VTVWCCFLSAGAGAGAALQISDLRSSNVRDCCEFLKTLSRVSRDAMRYLLRDVLQTVVEQIKVPNKVTSGYVDECIQEIIHHTTYVCCLLVGCCLVVDLTCHRCCCISVAACLGPDTSPQSPCS